MCLPFAAVVTVGWASPYLCLLSQHAMVYGHQNMLSSHQPHIPLEPPQFWSVLVQQLSAMGL